MTFLNINTPADAVWIGELTDEQRALMDDPAWFFYEHGRKVSGTDMVRANLERMRVWQKMQEFHSKYDLLLTPVISCTLCRNLRFSSSAGEMQAIRLKSRTVASG